MADIEIQDYVPPKILDDMDVDTIHARMMNDIPTNIDKTEGGFAWDMTKPSAIEKSYAMEALNTVVQIMFPEWSTGYFLDLHAIRVGISRKKAVAATGNIRVVGKTNAQIAKDFVFCTPATPISSSIEFVATKAVTLEQGESPDEFVGIVPVKCAETGLVGNVPMDSVTLMSNPLSGITEVTNPEAIGGGAEEETDDELRLRIMEIDRFSETSFVGNNNDYRRWSMEVAGVGSASVIREWMGPGTGTVKVVIMDTNGEPASPALIQRVYTHIMGTEDTPYERLAPIGAILTVATAVPMNVGITAQIVLEEGYTIDMVTSSFRQALKAYFEEAKMDQVLRYTRVGSTLSETPGVADYRQLFINGARQNLPVSIDDYPTLSSLDLTEAEVT